MAKDHTKYTANPMKSRSPGDHYPKLWGYSVTAICYRLRQLGWNWVDAHAALEKLLGCPILPGTVRQEVSDGKNPKYEQGRAARLTPEQVGELARAAGRSTPSGTPEPVAHAAHVSEVVGEAGPFVEGAVRTSTTKMYERNLEARRQCVLAHGPYCAACGMSFGEVYGPEAEGYIHVHHRRPLSEIGLEYALDPVRDLQPVCPNCHAILHHGRLRTVEDVKQMLEQRGRSSGSR